jgi:hypothetical protein
MNERRTSVLRAQVTAKAVDLLRVPGVLAAESGYRIPRRETNGRTRRFGHRRTKTAAR